MVMPSRNHSFASLLPLAFDDLLHGLMRWDVVIRNLHLPVTEDFERKLRNHFFRDPLPRLDRIFCPDRRTGRENFNERKPSAIALKFKCFAHRAAGLHDVLVVGQCDALDVDGSFERRQHLRHMQREPFIHGPASPWRRGAALTDEGCRAPSARPSFRRLRC